MDQAIFEKRWQREKRARNEAEFLLEQKSRELFLANEGLQKLTTNLENQSNELSAILAHADIAIFLVDSNSQIHRANTAAARLFEFALEETQSSNINQMIDQTAVAEFGPPPFVQAQLTSQIPGKAQHSLELSVIPVEIGKFAYTLWLCRDISRRLRAEQERLKLEHDLAQSQRLEALGVMASGIAHEINTPIQYVRDNVNFFRTAAETLQQAITIYSTALSKIEKGAQLPEAETAQILSDIDDLDLEFIAEELPEALEHSSDGLSQIARIVGAVKSFSHPGSDEKSNTNIHTLLNDVITVTRNQWKYRTQVSVQFDETIPDVPAFPGELNQVFMNMIINAADAVEETQRSDGLIKISTMNCENDVLICFEDNGCGISNEHIQKIYDPFFTTKEVGKGTGQGLSFCHNIVKKHDGQISVSSERGIRTMFEIRLPKDRRSIAA